MSILILFVFVVSAAGLGMFVYGEMVGGPYWRYMDHRVSCVERDGTVITTVDDVYNDLDDLPYTTYHQVGDVDELFGFQVLSIEDSEREGLFDVTLKIFETESRRTFTVGRCDS